MVFFFLSFFIFVFHLFLGMKKFGSMADSYSYPRKRLRRQNRKQTRIDYIEDQASRTKVISTLSCTVGKKALELINKTDGSEEDVKVFLYISYNLPDRRSIVVSSDRSIKQALTDIVNQCNAGLMTTNDMYCVGADDYYRFRVQMGHDHLKKTRAISIPGILPGLGRSLLLK